MSLNEIEQLKQEISRLSQKLKQTEKFLETSDQHIRTLIQAMPVGLLIADQGGFVEATNPQCLKLFRCKYSDLYGRELRDLFCVPDKPLLLIQKPSSAEPHEVTALRADGQPFPAEIILLAFQSAYGEKRLVLVEDITKRHELERLRQEMSSMLSDMISNMPVGLATVNKNGLIDFSNPAIQDLFEFSTDQLLGQNLNDLLGMSKKQCTDLLSGGQTIECEIDRGDTQIRVEATAREITILEQRRCLVMVANVTKRHELQRLKRQFLAMIAHDLRSPLTAISGTLELIARKFYDPDTERGQAGIRSASMNIDRMLRLISDLLEMEKFDATNLSLDIAKVNMRSIIDEALDSVRGTAEHSQVSLQKHLIDTELDADKLRMVQVLVNLLSNAIKYSPPNSTVSVNGRPEGRWVVVEVTDSGPGISEADQELIFEPYKQAKVQAGERRMEGTGLGLTICKSLVEAHRGRIGVANAKPSGSTFWVRIPIKQNDMSWRA